MPWPALAPAQPLLPPVWGQQGHPGQGKGQARPLHCGLGQRSVTRGEQSRVTARAEGPGLLSVDLSVSFSKADPRGAWVSRAPAGQTSGAASGLSFPTCQFYF